MPAANTFAAAYPSPPFSDDLVPRNRNVLYLITNLCRSSEKAAAVFAGLHPLEWLPTAKGRLKTSRQTSPSSVDTWSWTIEHTPADSRRNQFAESSSVPQKTSICRIGNPLFQQRNHARRRRNGQFSIFQRYKRNAPATNYSDCRIPVSRQRRHSGFGNPVFLQRRSTAWTGYLESGLQPVIGLSGQTLISALSISNRGISLQYRFLWTNIFRRPSGIKRSSENHPNHPAPYIRF